MDAIGIDEPKILKAEDIVRLIQPSVRDSMGVGNATITLNPGPHPVNGVTFGGEAPKLKNELPIGLATGKDVHGFDVYASLTLGRVKQLVQRALREQQQPNDEVEVLGERTTLAEGYNTVHAIRFMGLRLES